MKCNQHTKIITKKEKKELKTPMPSIWNKVIGILKGKKVDPIRYQKQIRKEWNKRSSKYAV